MTPKEIAERWADMCRSAESAGAQALRILEANLLKAMNDCASMEADRNRWVDVAGERGLQIEGHRTTIDQLRARHTPPRPKYKATRACGLHLIDDMTGKITAVDVDYNIDNGAIVSTHVWLGAHDIMIFLAPEHDIRLAQQIEKRLKEEETEGAKL